MWYDMVMTDEIETVGKVADATKEVAKTGAKALDSANRLANFLYLVLGEPIEITAGTFITDPLIEFRKRRLLSLQEKTEAILAETNSQKTQKIPPKVAVPLLEQASLEGEEELHTMWARLLANGLNREKPDVTKTMVAIMAELDHLDAIVITELSTVHPEFSVSNQDGVSVYNVKQVPKPLGDDLPAEKMISVEKLIKLGVAHSPLFDASIRVDGAKQGVKLKSAPDSHSVFSVKEQSDVRIEQSKRIVRLTSLGRNFLSAVSK